MFLFSFFNQNFIGDIDDIRIYNRVLSIGEIDSLFHGSCVFTNINSIKSDISFSVFPNPAQNFISIKNDSGKFLQFSLYNAMGKVIVCKTLLSANNSLDLSVYSKGIYFYKLISENILMKGGTLIIH